MHFLYKGKNKTPITLLPHSSYIIPKECPLLPYLGSLSKDFVFAKGCQTAPSHPKSWVRPCKDWNKWVEKLKPECSIIWYQLDITQFIQMTAKHITYQPSLLFRCIKVLVSFLQLLYFSIWSHDHYSIRCLFYNMATHPRR